MAGTVLAVPLLPLLITETPTNLLNQTPCFFTIRKKIGWLASQKGGVARSVLKKEQAPTYLINFVSFLANNNRFEVP